MSRSPSTALFVTCLVDQLFPEVGEAAVRLLEASGRRVEFPAAQTCCGQPAFNMGYAREARRLGRRMIEIFSPYDEVVAPSGSCASMVRLHLPELFAGDAEWRPRAEALAAKVFELTEGLARDGFDPGASRFEGRVTYHASCHLLRELFNICFGLNRPQGLYHRGVFVEDKRHTALVCLVTIRWFAAWIAICLVVTQTPCCTLVSFRRAVTRSQGR